MNKFVVNNPVKILNETSPVCEAAPTVANSGITTSEETLSNGEVAQSTVKYSCNEGYHIDDEANSRITCQLGSVWKPTKLPVCLKGC